MIKSLRKNISFIQKIILVTSIFYFNKVIGQTEYDELAGCWKGGVIISNQLNETDVQLRWISKRNDGSLALTMIYELGPRSRVWSYDTDIEYNGKFIEWFAHRGRLSQDKDTMWIEKDYKGEKSNWIFYKNRVSDPLMQKLIKAANLKYEYSKPEELNDGWNSQNIFGTDIEGTKIFNLIEEITKGNFNDIHSLAIAYNDNLILEEYFAEEGKRFGGSIKEIFRDKPHHLASTTKGITSLLTGIAIDKGFIKSVNETIYNYFPRGMEEFDSGKRKITIEDLLTMRSGLQWEQFKYSFNDTRNDAGNLIRAKDVVKYILDKPISADPGKKFNYTNGDPILLGAVLKNSTNLEVDQFAEKYLFEKLGVRNFLWTRYPDGTIEADGGLALCSRDLLKIGQLVLNKGIWNEEQIVSENWIDESTLQRFNINFTRGYGYYWNQKHTQIEGVNYSYLFVPGDGGQFLAIFPDSELVVVITAGNYGKSNFSDFYFMIDEYILPAIFN